MYIHKKYRLIFLLLVFCFQLSADENNPEKPDDCSNYVLIQGSSNINKFEFVNHNPNIKKTDSSKKYEPHTKNIYIPVYDFSGSNKLMLKDFYELLNARNFPFINIKLESYDTAEFDEETGGTLLKTEITIAGETRDYIIPCEIDHCKNKGMVIKGNLEVKLSAFNIEAPRKVLGTVKVDDEVFITFSFNYI